MLSTYEDQLLTLAQRYDVSVKEAFLKAGVPDSTYYRSMTGPRRLTHDVALKVAKAIHELAAENNQAVAS
jgi:predicted transcriptional regulator